MATDLIKSREDTKIRCQSQWKRFQKVPVMEQIKATTEQLRIEASINRMKVSEVAKELIEYCEKEKAGDCLVSGPGDHNPFQEKKSCTVL